MLRCGRSAFQFWARFGHGNARTVEYRSGFSHLAGIRFECSEPWPFENDSQSALALSARRQAGTCLS